MEDRMVIGGIRFMELQQIIEKVKGIKPRVLGRDRFASFGILIPLIKKDNEIHVVFEVRSLELRRQPGEICFPGGRIEKHDASPKEAALRETAEELGIPEEWIENVYPLDFIAQSAEGRIIYPFVGTIKNFEKCSPNPQEVKEVFTVPLNFLLNATPEEYEIQFHVVPEENFPYHLIPGGENYQWKTRKIKEYFYFYENYCIWGLTAFILRHFLSVIQK